MTAAAPSGRRWMFGPVPDLLFGCGVLYALAFGAQLAAGDSMRSLLPYALLPFLSLLLGAPHYGATLLRVFDARETNGRFVRFTVVLTVACLALFALGLRDFAIGSLIVTVYITWSPWHYSGQNYGVGLAFLRRRGVEIDPLLRRLLYGAILCSYLLTVLALHGADPSGAYAPVSYKGTAYQLLPLNLSRAWVDPLFLLCTVAFVVSSLWAALLLLRRAAPSLLLPTALVFGTQTLWFVAPSVGRHWGLFNGIDPLAPGNAAYTLMWVAVGHFLQYLWFTTFFAVTAEPGLGKVRYLGKALLAGGAIWVLPTLLFAPGLLGKLPYDFGLAVMAAAMVNIHHFILDGMIWKTRSSGPLTRLLAGPERPEPASLEMGPRWAPWLVWVGGAACLAVAFIGYWESEFGFRQAAAQNDAARYRQAAERVAWIGRQSPKHHLALAKLATRRGDDAGARRELEESLALFPTADAWSALAAWHERASQREEAASAYQKALALEPDDVNALYRLGLLWLQLGEPGKARDVLARAEVLAPKQRLIRLARERADDALRGPSGSAPGAATAASD